MGHHRYQRPKEQDPREEQLPLDTICTILTRQSTVMQAERHVFSAEVNPQDLVSMAERLGFRREQVDVVDADMGIGAYKTVIEDRPGLQKWLYEDLPKGRSLVVLTSNEDRLFRDKDEVEHNRFIRQVAKYGGWVGCGGTVYNFRREWDADRFRWAGRAGKEFIEGHLKRRLFPAIQRAAMQGRYTGGPVPWGYVVDYLPQSPTYKHLTVYDPHATLVINEVFRYFASLPRLSLMAVAYHWEHDGLLWPFYGPEIDLRVKRVADASRKRDEVREGYPFNWRQTARILTDVNYLGWRARAGEVAWDQDRNVPRQCHPPLVDADLFWWCFDHVERERLPWMPPKVTTVQPMSHPRRPRDVVVGEVRLLIHGHVRCATHARTYAVKRAGDGRVLLQCNGGGNPLAGPVGCPMPTTTVVDEAVARAFVEDALTLDEEDVAGLARLLEQRARTKGHQEGQLRQEIQERQLLLKRATQLAMRETNERVAEELLEQARQLTQAIAVREAELATLLTVQAPSSQTWVRAQQTATVV